MLFRLICLYARSGFVPVAYPDHVGRCAIVGGGAAIAWGITIAVACTRVGKDTAPAAEP